MVREMKSYKSVDEYVESFPGDIKIILQKVRETIRGLLPGSQEVIKYGIPTFRINNQNVVHFAGYKNHIGFYPGALAVETFKKEAARYHTGRGTFQFPVDEPIPYGLIEKITRFRRSFLKDGK